MQNSVFKYSIPTHDEIVRLLSHVGHCTCSYWRDSKVFSRAALPFCSVRAAVKGDILSIQFATEQDSCAFCISGEVHSAQAETDGAFFNISVHFIDDTEVDIFYRV